MGENREFARLKVVRVTCTSTTRHKYDRHDAQREDTEAPGRHNPFTAAIPASSSHHTRRRFRASSWKPENIGDGEALTLLCSGTAPYLQAGSRNLLRGPYATLSMCTPTYLAHFHQTLRAQACSWVGAPPSQTKPVTQRYHHQIDQTV